MLCHVWRGETINTPGDCLEFYHACPKQDTQSILRGGLLRSKSSLWKASGGAIYLNRGNCWMNKSEAHDVLEVRLPREFVNNAEIWGIDSESWEIVVWSDVPPQFIRRAAIVKTSGANALPH